MKLSTRIVVAMVFLALLLGGLGVRSVRTTEAELIRQVDAQLARAGPRLGPGVVEVDPGTRGGLANPLYVAVLDGDELRTLYVPQLTRSEPGVPDLDAADVRARAGDGAFTVGARGSDLRYRVQIRPERRTGIVLVYAAPLEDVDETLRQLRANHVLVFLAVMGALGAVAFWVIRLGVGPIRQMTDTATAIAEGDRTRRIPDTAPGTEAGELGVALNHMLGRIEDEFTARTASEDRLRRFVADASHELRTPITTIRGYAELYRMGGLDDPEQLSAAMRRTEQEALRMSGLVEDLLQLARLDEGRPLERSPVDLAAVLEDSARDARAVEPDRPVTVDAAPLTVPGDEARIRQVVANLVANARTHTPPGTPVHLRASSHDGWALIEVHDEGPGMAPDVAARAFERFYRADDARHRATGGSGLGLSIVAAVAAAHRGHARITSAPGAGTTVQVAFPLDGGVVAGP